MVELANREHQSANAASGLVSRRSVVRGVAALCAFGFILGSSCGSGGNAKSTTPAGSTQPVAGGGVTASGQRDPGNTYGSYGVYKQVSFAQGTSATTVSDRAARGTVNGYLFAADGGQKFILNLVSPNATFDVYGPDDAALVKGKRYAEISPLPSKGDYLVVVVPKFGTAAFDLLTEITSTTATPTVPSTCKQYVEFNGDFPMRQCHKGAEVRAVQAALKQKGFQVDVDGFFGPGTARALQNYFTDKVAVLNQVDYNAL